MTEDERYLYQLNIEIGHKESEGDQAYFESLLDKAFAMLRASEDAAVEDRTEFIAKVKKSRSRFTQVESITFYGRRRALVVCRVALDSPREGPQYHNVRLFTRSAPEAHWKLLAWANEQSQPGV